MAPRKTAATEAEESGPADLNAVQVKTSTVGIVRPGRPKSENPLKGVVEKDVPLMLEVTGENAKRAVGLLHRDAQDSGLGVSITLTDASGAVLNRAGVDWNQVTAVHFQGKSKSVRRYTIDDIKHWAYDNGFGEIAGRVPAEVRKAFRVANGYEKSE